MKKILFILITFTTAFHMSAAVADTTLLRFDLTHFDDWTYHRPGVELTGYFIQQGKVNLFVSDTGANYTLESPAWKSHNMDSIRISVLYKPQDNYQANKIALQIDILNREQYAVSTITLPVPKNVAECELEATLPIPVQTEEYTLLFSAPKADVTNCAAVRMVKVWAVTAIEPIRGDVNGDGVLDVGDINILINIILQKSPAGDYDDRAFINDDDIVDIADVNALINLILARSN